MLAVDVGGRNVKFLATGEQERRSFPSGELGAAATVERVLREARGWEWEVVSLGVPAVVVAGRVAVDPVNLGEGWAGFDFEAAFGRPTKVVNDAVMQAIGSYQGGRMLFLGLGTGLGSALVDDGHVEAMELGHWPFRDRTFEWYVSRRGLERIGHEEWEEAVHEVVGMFVHSLAPDEVVLGGSAADELQTLPERARRGANENAFLGGFALWSDAALARSGS